MKEKAILFTIAGIFIYNFLLAQSQLLPGWKTEKLNAEEIPLAIPYKGNFFEGKKWTDNNGENILVLSKTDPEVGNSADDYSDERSADLFALQYVLKDGAYSMLWQMHEFIKSCPVEITLTPFKNSTSITDLDSNGITETTLVYKMACKSDESSNEMKVLMHENSKKYALRGLMVDAWAQNKEEQVQNACCIDDMEVNEINSFNGYSKMLGKYYNENDFKNAPAEFLQFAIEQWKIYAVKN